MSIRSSWVIVLIKSPLTLLIPCLLVSSFIKKSTEICFTAWKLRQVDWEVDWDSCRNEENLFIYFLARSLVLSSGRITCFPLLHLGQNNCTIFKILGRNNFRFIEDLPRQYRQFLDALQPCLLAFPCLSCNNHDSYNFLFLSILLCLLIEILL